MRIAFIHPDLGIGGAERLVVDAAIGLQDLGHAVTIYTSRCDRTHCFEEISSGQLDVQVRGDRFVPRTVLGRFAILCAIVRQLVLCFYLLRWKNAEFDAVFVDQLSFCVPLLKYGLDRPAIAASSSRSSSSSSSSSSSPKRTKKSTKILFYCHFPDKLLAHRTSALKKLYRIPFDAAESISTAAADIIVVNSRFTQGVFRREFPSIDRIPDVVYPCVSDSSSSSTLNEAVFNVLTASGRKIALSINRFERKKSVDLAIRAYAALRSNRDFSNSALVIAGGYDFSVAENVGYLAELERLCDNLAIAHRTIFELDTHVTELADALAQSASFSSSSSSSARAGVVIFLPSVSSTTRTALLRASRALLYTPENEHFGIVPLEAMLERKPVLAATSGGPLETIADGVTGWLRDAQVTTWAPVLNYILFEAEMRELSEMGERGRGMVLEKFSRGKMAATIEKCFLDAIANDPLSYSPPSSSSSSSSRTTTTAYTPDEGPALMRSPRKRDAAWIAFLGWAVYYCKYGFSLTMPSASEAVVGGAVVLVVYYALF
ncbi:alpha-1,3/1,6-mannosyltransferase ALG2 [Myxozyma melibiosi]|uniref:Alpha-1,3/1,6-mannosyltransferase ALG2 n=1 Tax=Myxozyma melibiosi TaxID=54550 RepID=A0ABR1F5K3_9ASCO